MITPLNEQEMYGLLKAAYPGKFADNDDGFEDAQEFAEDLSGWSEVADLLGRVVMLAVPMKSVLRNCTDHVLGEVKKENDGSYYVLAAVKRSVKSEAEEDAES